MIKILGIKIIDRIKEAGITQEILSKYAGLITTRLGFHELTTDVCSREAYIILHISGDNVKSNQLLSDLKEIGGIDIREMEFDGSDPFINFTPEEGALRILGILVEKRDHKSVMALQKTLTSFGCVIRTRLGVNEEFFGRPAGLILVELMGDEIQMDLLENELQKISGVHLRKMAF
jgi:predicted RNA-binding protein